MKKISILVPCCNVEKYIRECLDSIKVQTYTNLEVICIDDGSKDSTGDIIDEYVAADPRFSVIHKPNSGYGDSMNKGLDMCTGDYVGIIESDDWIEPDMFEVLFNTCEENNLDLVHCLWQAGPTGTESVDMMPWIKKNVVFKPLEKQGVFYMQPSIWAALYRRDLLEEGRKIRFLPTPGASFQDASFAFKCNSKSQRFMMIDKALHHYRINPNSSVSSSGKIYCVVDEWHEMKRWINEDPEMKATVVKSSMFPQIVYGGFNWNYQRLSMPARLLFLRAANRFFKEMQEEGLMNLYKYADNPGGRNMMLTLKDPMAFHLQEVMGTVNMLFGDSKGEYEGNQDDLISVVVTTYNTSKYIQSSLESIMRQSYRNIEILCVDDCSTDETEMLVRHAMRKDKRISWLCTEKNSGLSASRNLGLDHCKGKYVLFVDGDDCLMPDSIAIMHSNMSDKTDMVAGSALVGYEGGREAYGELPKSDDGYYRIKHDKAVNAETETDEALKVHVSAWGKLWRRSVIDKYHIRFPEGLLYEDANFFWKYLCAAPRMQLVKQQVCYYQRHLTGSIMSSTFNKKEGYAIQHLYILDDLYEYLCRNNLLEMGRKVLAMVYEPYFWFAYINSPKSDYDKIFATLCRILKEQGADVSANPFLKHVSGYEEVTKAEMFLDVYNARNDRKRKKKHSLWKKITKCFHKKK